MLQDRGESYNSVCVHCYNHHGSSCVIWCLISTTSIIATVRDTEVSERSATAFKRMRLLWCEVRLSKDVIWWINWKAKPCLLVVVPPVGIEYDLQQLYSEWNHFTNQPTLITISAPLHSLLSVYWYSLSLFVHFYTYGPTSALSVGHTDKWLVAVLSLSGLLFQPQWLLWDENKTLQYFVSFMILLQEWMSVVSELISVFFNAIIKIVIPVFELWSWPAQSLRALISVPLMKIVFKKCLFLS